VEPIPVGRVIAIYVADAAGTPPRAVDAVRAVPGRGLEGDRYFDARGSFSRWPDAGRAVSLIEQEALDAIAREHGIDLHAGRHRRNIVTDGVRLADLDGRKFRIGSALLRGARLCAPCRYLERITVPGVYEAMKKRGGLRADVWQLGEIRVGDLIVPA
jgi:MOSC domain-containing protein YiiM